MALQFSDTVRNARLDAIETAIGVSAVLKIRTGAAPANCAAADTGTVLATLSLPSDWMAAASGGSKAKSGTWQDAGADATGRGHHPIGGQAESSQHRAAVSRGAISRGRARANLEHCRCANRRLDCVKAAVSYTNGELERHSEPPLC
jgi:hypothetical protein